jgi:hypothetical protein
MLVFMGLPRRKKGCAGVRPVFVRCIASRSGRGRRARGRPAVRRYLQVEFRWRMDAALGSERRCRHADTGGMYPGWPSVAATGGAGDAESDMPGMAPRLLLGQGRRAEARLGTGRGECGKTCQHRLQRDGIGSDEGNQAAHRGHGADHTSARAARSMRFARLPPPFAGSAL